VKVPIFLDARNTSALHEQLLMRHGGASGVRDGKLLESALPGPRQHVSSPDIIDMATAYTAGMVMNHPFVDGNKRTGFVVGVLFLELNGFDFIAWEAEAAQTILELAAGTIDETGFALFLPDHVKRVRRRPK